MSHGPFYTNDTPVLPLDARIAFEGLQPQQKSYAHFLSKASWFGSLAVLFQTSPESPLAFVMFRKMLNAESLDSLKQSALTTHGFSESQWKAFTVYVAAFYCNMGNYRGFGDSKFVPDLPKELFRKLVQGSKAFEKEPSQMEFILNNSLDRMFNAEGQTSLGFPPEGNTTYFSSQMNKADSDIVKKFFEANRIDAYNTRVYKTADNRYVIRFASVKTGAGDVNDEEGQYMQRIGTRTMTGPDGVEHKFELERGDHSFILEAVNRHLSSAKKFAVNENEQNMLEQYIRHFDSGDLNFHKAGSRFWIKDKGPIVESYIGFIENYRDPAGQRAEFEGFVAIVNQEMSKKFEKLVHGAPELLKKLPWGETFEKDNFLKPDFTSLDVLTFSGSGIPAGINIPNYDEIRQSEGFKNVSLGNVIQASFKVPCPNFLYEKDAELVQKYSADSFEVQVGLHELLGHGSGKLFKQEDNGSLNFEREKTFNWRTNKPVDKWYLPGESYDSKFGSISSVFEECRAEAVGLFLSLDQEVLNIFGFTDPEVQKNIIYVNWMCMIQKGIEGLKMYNPANKQWSQAHSQARFVIARILLENAPDFVKILVEEEDLRISMKDSLDVIREKGGVVIDHLLRDLQLWKSTGDSQSAIDYFNHLSDIDTATWNVRQIRQIVLAREKPRRLMVQASTFRDPADPQQINLRIHSSTHEGIIESFQYHFNTDDDEQSRGFEDRLVEHWTANELGKMF